MLNSPDEFELAMYAKAQETHKKLGFQPHSLKEHCFMFFINDVRLMLRYTQQQHSTKNLVQLPAFLRNQLLEFIMRNKADLLYLSEVTRGPSFWSRLICGLLNKDLKKLNNLFESNEHTHGFLESHVNLHCALLANIILSAPNLEEFSFELNASLCNNDNKFLTPRSVTEQILKLKNLKRLSCTGLGCLSDSQIQDICNHLPNLISLKLILAHDVTPQGLAHLVSLNKLKVFYFTTEGSQFDAVTGERKSANFEHDLKRVFIWCAQNLPNLELCCEDWPKNESHPNLSIYGQYPSLFKGTSQLKILPSSNELPEAALPNLHFLYFKGPILNSDQFFARFSSYTKLTSLMLIDIVEAVQTNQILVLVGHQLSSLFLFLKHYRVNDFKILALCPKLRILENYGSYNDVPEWSIHLASLTPKFLETVKLGFNGAKAPEGLIKLLVTAPSITLLSIERLHLCKRDCLSVYQYEGLKSLSLQKLFFRLITLDQFCELRCVETMVKRLICNSHGLAEIEFYFDDYDGLQEKCDFEKYLNLVHYKFPHYNEFFSCHIK